MKHLVTIVVTLIISSFAVSGEYSYKGHAPQHKEVCAPYLIEYGEKLKMGTPEGLVFCYLDARRVGEASSTVMDLGFFLGGEVKITVYMDNRTFSTWTFTDGKLTSITEM